MLKTLREIFIASVRSVQPKSLLKTAIKLNNDNLYVRNHTYKINRPIYVIGFGKAVLGMAETLEKLLNDHIHSGIINIPKNMQSDLERITVRTGAENNIPDRDAYLGTKEILEYITSLDPEGLLIILISGGGSALFTYPKPPMTLETKANVIRYLAKKGATIQELNGIRQKLSLVKGGKLLKHLNGMEGFSLILSDVIGDPIELIASGPTCRRQSVNVEAIVNKYLNDYDDETVKQLLAVDDDDDDCKENVENIIVGNNQTALTSAQLAASKINLPSFILSSQINGNVKDVAHGYQQITELIQKIMSKNNAIDADKEEVIMDKLQITRDKLEELKNAVEKVQKARGKRFLIISGGETTVEIHGNGKGGRNQQLALTYTKILHKSSPRRYGDVLFLSAGTDGIDGPTDVAGAFGGFAVIKSIESNQCFEEVEQALANNDCYNFYSNLNNGEFFVKIGHSGTNVMDLHMLYVEI